jgi:hypothetical protein
VAVLLLTAENGKRLAKRYQLHGPMQAQWHAAFIEMMTRILNQAG